MKTLIAVLFSGVVMSACAPARLKTCDIKGVTIHAVPAEQIDNYCLGMLAGNMLNDAGAVVGADEKTTGCAKENPPEIAFTNADGIALHELKHLLAWFCGDKEP